MSEPKGDTDFFISYRGTRTDWALWINWVLRSAGFSTIVMNEFKGGLTWTDQMREACEKCRRLIPLYSKDYWKSGACTEEFDTYWRQAMADRKEQFLLPLELEESEVPDIHQALLTKRLYGLNQADAHAAILHHLKGITPVTATLAYTAAEPPFPGVPSATVPAGPAPLAFQSTVTPVDRENFVNCTAAFTNFEQMLTTSACHQILLVQVHGKQGKSTLLSLLSRHARKLLGPKSEAFEEFKQGASEPEEFVRRMARALGVNPPSNGNIEAKLDELLDARQDRPTVLFFDAYEHAEQTHRHWIDYVLSHTVNYPNLRVVVAGRSLPNYQGKRWAHLVLEAECDALKEPSAIISHAMDQGFQGKPEEITNFLTRVVSMRDRLVRAGQIEHGITCETVLLEIRSMCPGGNIV